MAFDNVNIEYQNASDGPDVGRVYTLDHVAGSLIVKTNPGGNIINTIPLDTPLQNEVLELEYDGFYFYTLIRLLAGNGIRINKWQLNSTNTLLIKVLGAGNEITLLNTASQVYNAEAFAVHRYQTTLQTIVPASTTSIILNDTTDLSLLDSIYLGPSSAASGEREAFTVIGILGNTVTLNQPTLYQYNTGDTVIYRKNTYVFNNFNGVNPIGGSLVNLDQKTGNIIYNIPSNEWAQVTAASSLEGALWFVRNAQLYRFKPLGANAGYLTSLLLKNIEPDKRNTIKVLDMIITDNSIQKLQQDRVIFNTGADQFQLESGANDRYHIDEEFLAPTFKSVTAERQLNHVLLGENKVAQFNVKVLDQYNVPIFSRNLNVTEDDPYGFIEPGFESIITDVSGQGITRYNSGLPVEATYVTVTVRDIITQLPGKFNLEQFDFIEGTGFIDQREDLFGRLPVEQRLLVSSGSLVQSPGVTSKNFLVQRTGIDSGTYIDQYSIDKKLPIEQRAFINNITPIDQRSSLIDIAEVNQFIFLLFALPLPFSVKNPVDTNILIRIVGFGAIPLDTNTLVFKVNGIDVAEQVIITPFGGGLQLEYDPPLDFDYGATVSIEISISDTDVPPNDISVAYTFDTIDDFLAPTLIELFPANNSENNTTDTVIYAIIEEDETALDLDSIEFYVEGIKVDFEVVSITDSYYQIIYRPDCKFTNNVDIDINIKVADIFGNLLNIVWGFQTIESSDVLFINRVPDDCQVFVPIESPICFTAVGKEDGIQIQDSKLSLDGKEVKFVLKPKVYRNR